MSIFEKVNKTTEEIKGQIQREEKISGYGDSIVQGIESFYAQGILPKMKASEYLRAAQGWVYGCVNVIADEIAGIGIHLIQYENGEQVEIDEHPALDVLYRANNAMTRFDLIQLTFQYLELTGEAPWFVSFKNNKPDSIILLRPDRLTVKPGKDGELIGGYTYKVYTSNGVQEIQLEPYEVIPLKYADPDNPLRGKGPLQAAAITYDLDNYAEKWNSQFFKNSAMPSAALKTDKTLSKDVRTRLEKKLNDNYRGTDNAHKTMILEGGLSFEKMSLSQKDMDFISQQQFSRDKILSIFRVPKTALGLTEDVNRANAEATDYVFAKRTIKPKMKRFTEQLDEFFLPLFGDTGSLFFDFDDPVPQNVDQEITRAQSGVNTGYMTINEAREIMGLDPIDGGDVLRDPTSFSPVVDANGDPVKSNAKKKKKPATVYQKQLKAMRERPIKEKTKEKKLVKQVIKETVIPIVYNYLKNKQPRKRHSYPFTKGTAEEIKEEKWAFQTKQLNVATKYEATVADKMDKIFKDQLGIVLKQIDSGEKPKLNIQLETEKTMDSLKPTMIKLMREQSDLAFQIVGVTHPFNDNPKAAKARTFLQRLSDFFEIRAFNFSTEISKETNRKLGKAFAQGVAAGESIAELKNRVTDLFGEMQSYRSERIARTETILASNFSTEEAYKESGVVEAKEWLATRDERTDDECAALDGKVVSLGSKFFPSGYFTGQTPPIHVNCRCTLIPIVAR